ncbi:DUF6471 domain-containing protein [Cupriavidus basilensis]|uniref:DUF6471 domain-containing protein n=1 Tax=Cupriavidus basilensis TaxID=68895 RepID=UPI001F42D66A|nr:DUF6471 domain-containing protein [Cupriavidus basilensis]
MPHTDSAWTRLAGRTARGVLARKDCSFEELAVLMSATGIPESFRSVESKIRRGSFSFAFFLAMLWAVSAECPAQWRQFVHSEQTWEDAAHHIFLHEAAAHRLNLDDLPRRLEAFASVRRRGTLTAQVTAGTFPFTLLLQLASVVRIPDFSRFVDDIDLAAAAADDAVTAASKRPPPPRP